MSDHRKYLLLLGLIVLALAGVAYMGVPGSPGHQKTTLGLDLQGGLEVVLKAVPPQGQKVDSSRMSIAQNIMRNRVDKLGVSEPEVRRQGSDQIVIQLAGVHDPKAAAALIGKTAQLEFYDLEADLTGPSKSVQGQPNPEPNVYSLLASQQALVKEKGASAWYLFDKTTKKVIAGPAASRDALFDTKPAKKLGISAGRSRRVPRRSGEAIVRRLRRAEGHRRHLLRRHRRRLSGRQRVADRNDVVPLQVRPEQCRKADPRADRRRPEALGNAGRPRPEPWPRRPDGVHGQGQQEVPEDHRGPLPARRSPPTPQHFAIVLDREIKSFPQIDYTDSSLAERHQR